MKKITLLFSLMAGLILSSALFANEKIIISNEGLYPEGVSYDPREKLFYVSSVARGEVWRVNKKGESELFLKNNRFPSTIGLHVDIARNRLIICVADPGVGKNSQIKSKGRLAGVAIYDLKSKKELAYYNLASKNNNKRLFANDSTTDEKGNIYITDSFSPIIYKIDTHGKIIILANSSKWNVAKGKFGLNGIVYHSDGFLIVSHYSSGKRYKVDVNNSDNIQEIIFNKLSSKWKISGLDGLLLLNNKTLAAVNVDPSGRKNGNIVYNLLSNDNWDSFDVDGVMPTSNTYPTTLTNAGDGLFVLHAKLLELFTGNKSPERTFEIERVSFSKPN